MLYLITENATGLIFGSYTNKVTAIQKFKGFPKSSYHLQEIEVSK